MNRFACDRAATGRDMKSMVGREARQCQAVMTTASRTDTSSLSYHICQTDDVERTVHQTLQTFGKENSENQKQIVAARQQ